MLTRPILSSIVTHTNVHTVFRKAVPASTNHIRHHPHHHRHRQSDGLWTKRRGVQEKERLIIIAHKCSQTLRPSEGQFPDRGSRDGSLPLRCNYFKRDWAVKHLKTIAQDQRVFMLLPLRLWGPCRGGVGGQHGDVAHYGTAALG